jgi:signal transduction histidine kinase
VIAVHNRGTVIAADDQEQIFNLFKRIPTAGTLEKDQGSMGLGLYIAQQIAIAHGGSIDVESSDELGTTFKLHLPNSG